MSRRVLLTPEERLIHKRKSAKKWYNKHKNDPDYKKKVNEKRKEYYWKNRERYQEYFKKSKEMDEGKHYIDRNVVHQSIMDSLKGIRR
jgi:hypothetical protein